MITLTHDELQKLIKSEVSKALKDNEKLILLTSDLLSKVGKKLESMEKELQERDKTIKELVDGMKKIILTKQFAYALQIPGEIIWSVSSTSMINIAKRTLKNLGIE